MQELTGLQSEFCYANNMPNKASDLEKLCRACGCSTNDSVNIFERRHRHLAKQIEDIIDVKLKCSKHLPKRLCPNCQKELSSAYAFRKLCLTTQEYFASQEFREAEVKEIPQIKYEPECITVIGAMDAEDDQRECLISKIEPAEVYEVQEQTPSETNALPPESETKTKRSSHKNGTPIICEHCGNQFTCRNQFLSHQKRHMGEKPYQCEICSNKFFTHSELKRHMRRHTGERPFPCSHCQRRFTDYSTRLKHERTHTNERPYKCTHCEKAFTTTYILKNHLLTHTGQREFNCTICDKYFVRHTHLVVHYRSLLHKQNEAKYRQTVPDHFNGNCPTTDL